MPPRFQKLTIAAIARETADSVSLTFDARPSFRPGQYVTLRAEIDGVDVRRSYSICAGLDDPALRVGIKHLPGGLFSTWANTVLKPGDTVLAMPPDGRFGASVDPEAAHVYAAFAAGSGITPILSIVKTVLARGSASRFFLFLGNRRTADIMFRTEIEDLKDRYLSRLSVFHVLSRERQELDILNGHLDAGKIPALMRLMPALDQVFVCGPTKMIEGLELALIETGLPRARIHVERFTPASDSVSRPAAVIQGAALAAATQGEALTARASLILDGARQDVPMAAGESIVDAAIRAGLDPPFSCKAGMCCTCRARLLDGRVEMAANYSLEPWETAAGYVLTCQARPLTPHVVVDYDQV